MQVTHIRVKYKYDNKIDTIGFEFLDSEPIPKSTSLKVQVHRVHTTYDQQYYRFQ